MIACSPSVTNEDGEQVAGFRLRNKPYMDVKDGNIFVGSYDGYLYCFSMNGKMLWRFKTGEFIGWSHPTIYDKKIFFGSFDKNVYCLDMSGRLVWKFLTGDFVGESPLVYKDRVYSGSNDGYMYCLDMDGKMVWKFRCGGGVATSPIIINDIIYFGSLDTYFYALDTGGNMLWKFGTGFSTQMPVTSIIGRVSVITKRFFSIWKPETRKTIEVFKAPQNMQVDYKPMGVYSSDTPYSIETPYTMKKKRKEPWEL